MLRKSQRKELFRVKAQSDKNVKLSLKNLNSWIENLDLSVSSFVEAVVEFELIKIRKATTQVHEKKINSLKRKTGGFSFEKASRNDSSVVNLSSYALNDSEKEMLSLGMSMCWSKEKLFLPIEKAEAEAVARRLKRHNLLSDDIAFQLKAAFRWYFKKGKIPLRERTLTNFWKLWPKIKIFT